MKTLTVDDYQRVWLPEIEPRTKFAYAKDAQGRITLTEIKPARARPARVRFVRKGGYSVATTDQPITEEAIKTALAEFP